MAISTKALTGRRQGKGLCCTFLLGAFGLLMSDCVQVVTLANSAESVQFNRDIRPILSDTCFPCHGFDANKRKANLRLDTAEGLKTIIDGRPVIKPGDPAGSELWRRVNSKEPKVVMPPPETGKKLEPTQIELFGKWIAQGGEYQTHWAFVPPSRPQLPQVKMAEWAKTPIDRFILATLEKKGLSPSPVAQKETLARRLSLALTGLPPSLQELDAFLADTSQDAYERLVDKFLASPRYSEHMARYWLDVARYGDTHGLHLDNERSLWPYRDWVVEAFNKNLPFDQFTVWQLAGDLLPEPTREQVVASGFNRCNVSTSEGGAIDEEFQVRYAIDRVETTSTVWMGLTMGCAVCHDHKLDPITQKEFYQMFSIFNNIAENAMDGNALLPPPTLPLPSKEQEKAIAEMEVRSNQVQSAIAERVAALEYIDPATLTNMPKPEPIERVWLEDDYPRNAEISVNDGNEPSKWVTAPEAPVLSGSRSLQRHGKGLHQAFFSKSDEPLKLGNGSILFANVYLDPKDPPQAIMLQFYTDSWKARANWGDPDSIPYGVKGTTEKVQMAALPETGKWVRLEIDASKLGFGAGTTVNGIAFTQFDGNAYWDKIGVLSHENPAENPELSLLAWQKQERMLDDKSSLPTELKNIVKVDPEKRDDEQRKKLRDYFLASVYTGGDSNLITLRTQLKDIRRDREALDKQVVGTMISKELDKPRPAWVLNRGEYDKKGVPVGPDVPAILPPLPATEKTNRLTLARWLVDPKHPLTARVTVNRLWQQIYGTGLVKTAEDFGTKGEWPSHPELLDWLATEFMESGWNVKALVRLIVTSATFQQDSKVTPALAQLDPENRLLARGPCYRLDAEVLRDEALFLSGLINLKMGGRGVRPYQPPGIWEAVGYTTSNTAKYSQDHSDNLYRRSLYLFWKRTAPPPSMTTLDAPSREKCTARRERTDTPLQALLTMNDTQFFEAARHFATRMLNEGGTDDAARLRYGFRLATDRLPTEKETGVLARTLAAEKARYELDPESAANAISVGESPVPNNLPATELAAYTVIANLLLNLDEVVTLN